MPVFTIGNQPTCGIEEHSHGTSCYTTERTLVCGMEETVGHTHTEACKDADGAFICGFTESAGHTHSDSCYLTESKLTCQIPEHHHTDACYESAANNREVTSDVQQAARTVAAQSVDEAPDYSFSANIPANAGIPEDAQLVVREIEPGSDEFNEYAQKSADQLADKGLVATYRFFDVSFIADGTEVEPTKAVEVHTTMNTGESLADDLDTSVVHFTEDGIEVIEPKQVEEADGNKTEISYSQESFSIVGIVQTNTKDAVSFKEGHKYMLYADGYAVGIDASWVPSMTKFPVTVEEGRVVPASDTAALQTTWVYRNGGLYNEAYGRYLSFSWNNNGSQVGTSSSPLNLTTRFVGNTVRLSTPSNETSADNHKLYFGYDMTTHNLRASLKYAGGTGASGSPLFAPYFAVAEVGEYTPSPSSENLTIKDDIKASGTLTPNYTGSGIPAGATCVWQWEKKNSDGTWEKVERKVVTGTQYNVAEDGSWLNVAYDKGAEQVYRVRLVSMNGTTYDNVVSSEYQVPYFNQLQNGSFEAPYINPNTSSYNEDYQVLIPEETYGLAWKTTASDSLIEVASVEGDSFYQISRKWHNCPEAADGKQYAELNATEPGALYQDVLTTPGATMYWQASHRGRGTSTGNPSYDIGVNKGVDTMYVVIMSTELAERYDITTQARVQDVVNNPSKYPGAQVTTCTTDNSAWKQYSNTLTVPDNQYLTRFFFVAGPVSNPGTPAGSVGNHLDNVWFSEELPPAEAGKVNLEVKKTIAGFNYDEAKAALDKMTFDIDQTMVRGTSFTQLSPNDDGTFTASYVIRNLELGSQQTERRFNVSENASSADVDGYERSTKVAVNGGDAQTATSGSVTVTSGNTGTVAFINSYEQPWGSVTFSKVDGAGNTLPNAKFALFTDENCENVAVGPSGEQLIATSSDTGEVSFGQVALGTYYLKEIVAPNGFKLDETVYVAVVKKDSTEIYNRDTAAQVTQIVNQSNGVSVRLWKLDDSQQEKYLSGARFELAKKNAAGEYEKLAFNAQTFVEVSESGYSFGTLETGEYRLTETLAPAGYYRITEPIYFTVSDGQLTLAESTGKPWSLREIADDGSQGERQYSLLVNNHPGAELPGTGGQGVNLLIGGGVILLCACVTTFAVLTLRRREESK